MSKVVTRVLNSVSRKSTAAAVMASLLVGALFTTSRVEAGGTPLTTVRVASGLIRPLYVTAPPGDTSRIFVVEQRNGSTGRIRIVNIPANTLNTTPYLSIAGVATGSEQGLLGLAFHPDFMNNGYFYVNYTRAAQAGVSAGSTVVARYQASSADPSSATADAASATTLLEIRQPDANHNGGWIAFGPDGFLYIATGDGGCGNDTNCGAPNPPSVNPPGHTAGTGNAQDISSNLLGKMLRIDVDGPDDVPGNADDADPVTLRPYRVPADNPFVGLTGDDEIFAFGLRNPWRSAFDRATGDIYIADVGQGAWEEVNYVPAGTLSGRNFGWRCMEGLHCSGLAGCTCNGATLTLPVHEYGHGVGISITGGHIYRGCGIPDLQGAYFFADYASNQIWSFRIAGGIVSELTTRTTELDPPTFAVQSISSFGEDASGEIYICDLGGGEVFKIVPNVAGADCNANTLVDACEGAWTDVDLFVDQMLADAPDPATLCLLDANGDTLLDGADVQPFVNRLLGL